MQWRRCPACPSIHHGPPARARPAACTVDGLLAAPKQPTGGLRLVGRDPSAFMDWFLSRPGSSDDLAGLDGGGGWRWG